MRGAVALADRLPDYQENIRGKIRALRPAGDSALGKASDTIKKIQEELTSQPAPPAPATASAPASQPVTPGATRSFTIQVDEDPAAGPENPPPHTQEVRIRLVDEGFDLVEWVSAQLGSALGVVSLVGIIAVFVIFMLIYREDLRDRLIRLTGRGRIHVTTQAMDDMGRRISRYLLAQTAINGSYGLAVGLGLWLIGLPNAPLWGLLAVLMRFIPYLGPLISSALPILLAFAVFEGWTRPLMVVGLFVVLELVSNNVMEPWLYGSSTGLSAVAVIVAAVFWAWMWGPMGLLLSTPMTVCLAVMGRLVPRFEFLDVLLGDRPVFDPQTRLYQRLLAMDQEEAVDLLEAHPDTDSMLPLFEALVLPVLTTASEDHRNGTIDRESHEQILETLTAVLREYLEGVRPDEGEIFPELEKDGPTPSMRGDQQAVLCLPARGRGDELASAMLAHLLREKGVSATAVSSNCLASEVVDRLRTHEVQVVCISALPPSAASRARYLCKRIRRESPHLDIVVGIWNAHGSLAKATERLTAAGANAVVSSYGDALTHIRQHPRPARS